MTAFAVVDASFMNQAIAGDPFASAGAITRFARLEQMAAPQVLDLEIAASFRRRVRMGTLSAPRAARALGKLAVTRIVRWDHRGFLGRIWELRENVSPYDAAYIALAEYLNWPLVTADERLARASGPRCEFEVVG